MWGPSSPKTPVQLAAGGNRVLRVATPGLGKRSCLQWFQPPWHTACHFVLLCLSASVVSNSATPRTVAHQAPRAIGFSRQDYCNGLPCPPLGDLPNPWIKQKSLASPHYRWVLCCWASKEAHLPLYSYLNTRITITDCIFTWHFLLVIFLATYKLLKTLMLKPITSALFTPN